MKIKKFTYASLLAMVLIICMFGFTACGKKLDSIELDTTNVKTVVEWNEDLDLTNLVVKAVYDGGKVKTVLKTKEYEINMGGFDKTVAKDYTITITYKEKEATFKVTVNERPAPVATAITLDTANVKKAYEWGEAFDATNLVVTKTMDYGNPQVATSEEIEIDFSAFNPQVAGTYTIVVKLKNTNYSQSFEVTVKERPAPVVTGIEIDTTNVKKTFAWGEAFNADNLVVTIVKDYGGNVTATSDEFEVISTEFNNQVAGTYTITVLLSGTNYSKTYTVTVSEPRVLSIALNTENVKKVFDYNDNFTSENLVVTKVTEAGNVVANENEINIDYSAFDCTTAGDYNIVVSLNGTELSQNYSVTVKPLTIKGIRVVTEDLPTTFYLGQSVYFGEDIEIYYTYEGENNPDTICTDAYYVDISGVNIMSAGDYDVNIIIEGTEFTAIVVVTILSETAPYDMQIANAKTSFAWGESFELGEGFTAKLLNYDNTETNLSVDDLEVDSSEFESKTEGRYLIIVKYGDFQKEYYVTVDYITEEQLYNYFNFDNIEVTTQSGKTFVIPYVNGLSQYELYTMEDTKFNINVTTSSNYGYVEYYDDVRDVTVQNDSVSILFYITNGENIHMSYYLSITKSSPLSQIRVANSYITQFESENVNLKIFANEIDNPSQIEISFNREEGYSWQLNGNDMTENTYEVNFVAGETYVISIIATEYGVTFTFQTITIKVEDARIEYFKSIVANYNLDGENGNCPFGSMDTGDYDYIAYISGLPTDVEITAVFNEAYAGYSVEVQKVENDAIYIGDNEYIITVKNAENVAVAEFKASIKVNYYQFGDLLNPLGNSWTTAKGYYVTTKFKDYSKNSLENIEFYNANNEKVTIFAVGENELFASYTVNGITYKVYCVVKYEPYAVSSVTVNNQVIDLVEEHQNVNVSCDLNSVVTVNFEINGDYRIFINYDQNNFITNPYTFTYTGDYESSSVRFDVCGSTNTNVVQTIYLYVFESTLVKSIKVVTDEGEVNASRNGRDGFYASVSSSVSSINVEVEEGYTYSLYVIDEQLSSSSLHLGTNRINIRIFDAQNNEVENKEFDLYISLQFGAKDLENDDYVNHSTNNVSGDITIYNLNTSKLAFEFYEANVVGKINGQVVDLSSLDLTEDLTIVELSLGSEEYPINAKVYLVKESYVGMDSIFNYGTVTCNGEQFGIDMYFATASVELPFNADLTKCKFDLRLKDETLSDYHFDEPYLENGKFVVKVWGNDETKNDYVFYIDIYKCGEYNSVTDLSIDFVNVLQQSSGIYSESEISINVKRGDLIRLAPINDYATISTENTLIKRIEAIPGIVFKAEGFNSRNLTVCVTSSDGTKNMYYHIRITVEEAENILSITSANETRNFNGVDFSNDTMLFDGRTLTAFFNAGNAEFNAEKGTVKLNFAFDSSVVSISCSGVAIEQGENNLTYQIEQLTDLGMEINYVKLAFTIGEVNYELFVRFDNGVKVCDITVGNDQRELIGYTGGYVGGAFIAGPQNMILAVYSQSQMIVDETGDTPVYTAKVNLSNLSSSMMVFDTDEKQIENVSEIELVLEQEDMMGVGMYYSALIITDGVNSYSLLFCFSDVLKAMGNMAFIIS